MRVLYISDLDGTLLGSNVKTSAYTNHVINALTSSGMLFSYATARSYLTAATVTKGLHVRIPIITYDGAVILKMTPVTPMKLFQKMSFAGKKRRKF